MLWRGYSSFFSLFESLAIFVGWRTRKRQISGRNIGIHRGFDGLQEEKACKNRNDAACNHQDCCRIDQRAEHVSCSVCQGRDVVSQTGEEEKNGAGVFFFLCFGNTGDMGCGMKLLLCSGRESLPFRGQDNKNRGGKCLRSQTRTLTVQIS